MSKGEFISQYKYRGKTIKEWELEAKNAKGLDENGNPNGGNPKQTLPTD